MLDVTDRDKHWVEVVPASETEAAEIKGLSEGHRYRLRARAVNKVGASEPTELSNPITAKNPWGKIKDNHYVVLKIVLTSIIPACYSGFDFCIRRCSWSTSRRGAHGLGQELR